MLAGFFIWRHCRGDIAGGLIAAAADQGLSHAIETCLPAGSRGNQHGASGLMFSWDCFPGRVFVMPVWLEILLNVIAFAGFIGIAKYHKAPGENLPDR